jgi:endo-1,4-beta-D-glucanase Y
MMKKGQIIFATALLVCANAIAVFAQNKPFPQQLTYPGCIKPSVSQATLNSDVLAYYNYWKGQYLKKSTANASHYYIAAGSTGGSNQAVTQSEAHGYGMVITALMAGADANAKTYYDGLYGMYDTHRSANNNNLMQWQVFADEHNANIGSATDGDMDIAYSLLLAHYQWGSNGTINYLAAAQKMITNGLKASYVYNTLRLGLADDATSDHLSTRPSDWMFDHMRAFKANTNDVIWDQLAANLNHLYQLLTQYRFDF